jgi:hypothetical protein
MKEAEWATVRDWFRDYSAGFSGPDGKLPPLLQLKAGHSNRVAANARDLAADLGHSPGEVLHAQTAGLLHDVGRFTQFRDFGTFSDPRSVNHGERGFDVLREDQDFGRIPVPRRDDLLAAVRHHNRRVLPEDLNPSERRLTEIVRDADKLDIFKVILDAIKSGEFDKDEAVFLHVPAEGKPNPVILECIRAGRTASYEDIRNRTDFGLQLLSWAFDLAFDATGRRLIERGLFDALIGHLPDDPLVRESAALARAHLHRWAAGSGVSKR